ncbi:MAG TPA: hypothetical protein DCL77_07020 [Prolixibacteraceae bacterium]|jgi:hypothetical protein|nr:hypothetical protein [Prolixibacteraceae bacterium]
MDKRKLVSIIIKDLEEIKVLSEEVAESEDDSSLIIDLALNRARLLCQEIGLLRELAGNPTITSEETYEVSFDKKEEENADFHYPDPELEILNFEDREYSEPEEMPEEEDLKEIGEEESEEDMEDDLSVQDEELTLEDDFEEEDIVAKDDDLIEIEEEDLQDDQEEITEEDLDDDDLTEDEVSEEEPAEEKEVEVHQPEPEKKIQVNELKNDPQAGVREIHIDDSDDQDDIQPVRNTPPAASTPRPPMREIPKPEFLEPESPEKMVMGDKFHKERSLNDTLGEKKPIESKLTNGRISNLKAAIGLNDRFLFIREIFDNNAEKYNKVIDHLDTLQQISEAVEYLKANLSMQKNEASMKFVDLLKRRFTP